LNSSELADRYYARMGDHDLEGMAALFAEAAVVILPDGRELAGLAAIRGMYQQIWTAAPSPSPQAIIAGPSGVAVEIETHLPDGSSRRTANVFHLDAEGRIVRLSIYKRGD
jgi:hypothetical protein